MSESAGPAGPPRWLLVVLACLTIGGLAFAAGRFTMFGTAPAAPASDSAEAGFARDMQVHHAQAIAMAMQTYRRTDDEELRVLAYDIAVGQAAQRGEMFDWLVQWGLPQAGAPMMSWMTATAAGGHDGMQMGGDAEPLTDAQAREAMGMATDAELARLSAAAGAEGDCLFLSLMIRHHDGSIPMADAVIDRATDPRVVAVAERIRSGQAAEIATMTAMQERLRCTG